MKLIEVEKIFPIGSYKLTFACSKCGVQYNRSFNSFGIFGRDADTYHLLASSKYCMFCGHKWIQKKIEEQIDICSILDITKDEVNDEQLVRCLKKLNYFPKYCTIKPNFMDLYVDDLDRQICNDTSGYKSEIWFVELPQVRKK